MSRLRIAAVAEQFGRDLEHDFRTVERLITTARAEGVRLLALPEACLGGYLLSLDGDSDQDAGPPRWPRTAHRSAAWPRSPARWSWSRATAKRTATPGTTAWSV
ncbi:hypothetical protein [Phytohabitans houttuyneae]|uniref:hypothetical protein n=1 Tax=Phytohabitans houttuyneae TaxID=1076126 RepID=UPI001FED0820|nr:hypothetical protein [Phytohabitans houttuyneae]